MKKIGLISAFMFAAAGIGFGQNLSVVEVPSLAPIIYGDILWLDKNNDQRLELLVHGDGEDGYVTQLFNNIGLNDLELDSDSELDALTFSASDQADFNNDGFADFVMTGLNELDLIVTNLYLNNTDGSFEKEQLDVMGVTNGKIKAADFNNDSYFDLILTGIDSNSTYTALVYFQNAEGEFILQEQELMSNYFGDITVFDADNDGDLDLLLTGFDDTYAPNAEFYFNDGDGFFVPSEEHGVASAYFTGVSAKDYDQDGDIDLLVNGSNAGYNAESWLYNNNGEGVFTINEDVDLQGLYFGSAQFVDIDDNGELDIFLCGGDSDGNLSSVVYLQADGVFELHDEMSEVIVDLNISSAEWADYDNDGDQDLFITGFNDDGDKEFKFYTNDLYSPTYVGLAEEKANNTVITPNPNDGRFQLRTDFAGVAEIYITNLEGVVVWSEFTELPFATIDSDLQPGVYIVYTTINKKRMVQKIVITE